MIYTNNFFYIKININSMNINTFWNDLNHSFNNFILLLNLSKDLLNIQTIDDALNKIGIHIMQINDVYKGKHFYNHLKKWKNINVNYNKIFYTIYEIYIIIIKKTYIGTYKELILNELQKYALNNDFSHIHNILNIALNNNYGTLLDKLKIIINLNDYINNNTKFNINEMKGSKIIKYLKKNDINIIKIIK
jgi:hypothetical protein